MKVSICIPQFNRIHYLLKSLEFISKQSYSDIEIVISDDASTDDTEEQITHLLKYYRYPIVYYRNDINTGYDRNYRKVLELATGRYCFVLGNDDSLNSNDSIERMVLFLQNNEYPDIGFCNFVEEKFPEEVIQRARITAVLGSGAEVALKYYSCFSFVAGIIYKKEVFDKFNSDRYDGSIYAQIALGCTIISKGFRLFSIKEPLVIKDLQIGSSSSNSYRDTLPRRWSEYKELDGGLKSVISVLFRSFKDTHSYTQRLGVSIFKKIYRHTLPFWILDYKFNNALPAAFGIFVGMQPWRVKQYHELRVIDQIGILLDYYLFSFSAILIPSKLFYRYKNRIYTFIKK